MRPFQITLAPGRARAPAGGMRLRVGPSRIFGSVFAFVTAGLQKGSKLDMLEARGTVRLALKSAEIAVGAVETRDTPVAKISFYSLYRSDSRSPLSRAWKWNLRQTIRAAGCAEGNR